jgi:hypothetical protein
LIRGVGAVARRVLQGTRVALRIATLVAAAALAVTPVIVLLDTALSSSVTVPAGPFVPTPSSDAQRAGDRCLDADGPITVVIELHQVDLANQTLTVSFAMCVGANAARNIQRHAGYGMAVNVGVAGPTSSNPQLVRFAESELHNGGQLESIGSVTTSLQGYPRAYPLDSYLASLTIGVGGFCPLPAVVVAGADPGVNALDWSTSVEELSGGPVVFAHGRALPCAATQYDVTLVSHRPAATRLFVLSLVVIPLLLIALLGVRVADGASQSIDALVGVAAIMLAILPIRTVLVPSDIPSLTLVDFALGSEMALLATGAVYWFLWPRTWRKRG